MRCVIHQLAAALTAKATAGEDFPLAGESLGRKMCRALYYSAMGVSVRSRFAYLTVRMC